MSPSRRDFFRWSAAAGSALAFGSPTNLFALDKQKGGKADKSLKLLILGGTGFLGPHTVEAALARGHTVTLFNRGKTNPKLFPDLEKLHGDRDGDLKSLEGRKWDVVIDNSGYVPRTVKASADLLAPNIGHYIFVSTMSVYGDLSKLNQDESAPVGKLDDETVERIDGQTYGPLKALCEQAATKAMGGRAMNVRPGLIVGPGDPSDRFTYWPVRVDRGGDVLCPGTPDDPISFIDVRDLANLLIRAAESQARGTCNVVGPAGGHTTMGKLLDACLAATKTKATLHWADAEFLDDKGVQPWSEMPVWLPPTGETAGFTSFSNAKAVALGLTFTPIAETVRDTLDWFRKQPEARQKQLRAGINPQREEKILAKLKTHKEKAAESAPAERGKRTPS